MTTTEQARELAEWLEQIFAFGNICPSEQHFLAQASATLRSLADQVEPTGLRPLDEAPRNADWIVGWFKIGISLRPITIHWASDLSGEEQPPYQGWFRDWGASGFVEVDMTNFIGWEPINEMAARAALNAGGECG